MTEKLFRTVPVRVLLGEEGKGFEEVPQRVQLMRTCSFFHDRYGKVEITRQMFNEMKVNFEAKVRGIDLMIDYAHDSEREAAGWIKALEIVENLELGEDQLWAIVDWTPVGRRTLSDKEFAYLSADFDKDYRDNENPLKKFGTVLLGAGLTNRPVIKKMNPAIQLSEYSQTSNKENQMTDEQKLMEAKLAQVNKLMEDMGVASIEDLMKAIADMKAESGEMKEEKQLSERKIRLSELFSKGKITKAQQDEAIKLKGEVFDGFVKLAELNEGIKTTEVGDTGNKNGGVDNTEVDPEDKLIALSEAMAKDKKIGITQAISIVLSENEELKKAYYKKVGTYDGEQE